MALRPSRQYWHIEGDLCPTAGAGLYCVSAFTDVGPFDESFHAYFEDVDWGPRAQLAGYRSCYVPTAVGYHMGGATTQDNKNPRYYELQLRNALAVMIEDVPARFLFRHLPCDRLAPAHWACLQLASPGC
jgi:GT2 family glycosyltransferase